MTARSPALTLNNGVTLPALGLGVFQSQAVIAGARRKPHVRIPLPEVRLEMQGQSPQSGAGLDGLIGGGGRAGHRGSQAKGHNQPKRDTTY